LHRLPLCYFLFLFLLQVLPWLFISGVEPAQDEKVLSDLEMTHVITLTADPEKVLIP
jgi:hypothetical protein